MPVKYIVLNKGKLVIERWVGTISHAELIEHERNQLNDTSIARGAIALADARQALFPETTLDGIRELAELHTKPENKTSISSYALLVTTETWPQAKILEKEAEEVGVMIITFDSPDVACTWLGIDTDTTMSHVENIV
jgi:hypothetical protein